ncbi:glycosyltransferase [Flavobacterium silvisoli]|uniref:Glycosyltransferase n=1 Tax=Flavobacterium silvisoli TaxID=2529433 RepID=A0A4Q9YUJ2_9FLAO|nr:glycosyltransferase [Flavobacterium silvisoli]TBX66363.1 glycosyltransferase [Flavobacterium silvisoli]
MIVFFLPDLRAGGAERVMLNLLVRYHSLHPDEALAMLLFRKEGPLLQEIPDTIPVFELHTKGATKSVVSFIRFCREKQPKIVFGSLGASLTTSLAKPFLPKRTVIINRIGNTIGAEKLLFTNALKRSLYIWANKIIAKKSDHVIFQCHYMAEDYIRETGVQPVSSSVIYNPVKIAHIQKLALQPVDKQYAFVAVGRLNTQKDYPTLIRACELLMKRGCVFTLAILGQGNLKKELEHQIQECGLENHVFLLGHQSNPYHYIQQSSYLVSSSLYEGFSNVIIEAFCLGKPVIATDCPGGNAEVIQHGHNGWLCQFQNPEALAETLYNGLQQNVQMTAAQIAQYGAERFSDDIIFGSYEVIIRRYLS